MTFRAWGLALAFAEGPLAGGERRAPDERADMRDQLQATVSDEAPNPNHVPNPTRAPRPTDRMNTPRSDTGTARAIWLVAHHRHGDHIVHVVELLSFGAAPAAPRARSHGPRRGEAARRANRSCGAGCGGCTSCRRVALKAALGLGQVGSRERRAALMIGPDLLHDKIGRIYVKP